MRRRRLVRVPASSANLGPGFDSFACALALHMELEVEETGRFGVHTDLKIARDRRNLAVRGFARLADPEPFGFRIESNIPLSGGLGSSAAAYVAGLMAADHLYELDADVLALATALEGHPDNVAAALHGGFAICADGEATRFDPPAGLEAVVVVPRAAVRTKTATIACTSRAASTSIRSRWRSCAAPAPSARSGRRSRAPARPCSSGAITRQPPASSRRCAARPRAGRR